jgi:single-strand DNA-binding protein
MLSEPVITIQGNLASDPELKVTNSGTPVATFSLAANPRVRNAAGEWEDGETVFLRITAWRDLAENVAESLRRGDPALVVGRFRQRTWKTDEGQDRRADEVQADTVAVPLDRRRVRMTKVTREHPADPAAAAPAERERG